MKLCRLYANPECSAIPSPPQSSLRASYLCGPGAPAGTRLKAPEIVIASFLAIAPRMGIGTKRRINKHAWQTAPATLAE